MGRGHQRKITVASIIRYFGWPELNRDALRALREWKRGRTFRQAEDSLHIKPRQRQKLVKAGELQVVGAGRLRRITLKSIGRYAAWRRQAKRARYGWADLNCEGKWMVTFSGAEERLDIGPRQRQKLAKDGKLQVVDGMVTRKSIRRYEAHRRKKRTNAH